MAKYITRTQKMKVYRCTFYNELTDGVETGCTVVLPDLGKNIDQDYIYAYYGPDGMVGWHLVTATELDSYEQLYRMPTKDFIRYAEEVTVVEQTELDNRREDMNNAD